MAAQGVRGGPQALEDRPDDVNENKRSFTRPVNPAGRFDT